MLKSVLAARRTIGGALGSSVSAATPWYRAGGAPAPLAAHNAKNAVSQAASYAEISGTGNNVTVGTAPAWDAVNGWKFDRALSHYLIAGANNGPNHVVIVRVTGMIAGNLGATPTPAIGAGVNPSSNSFQVGNSEGATVFAYGTATSSQTRVASGVLALAGNDIYMDGVAIGTVAGTFTGTPLAFFIGAHNNAGTPGRFATVNVQNLAIYGDDTNHAVWVPAVSAALAAL